MADAVKQPDNNEPKLTGFQAHPENINRKGRPPAGWSWADVIREVMERVDPQSKKAYKTALAEALFKAAQGGDVQALKEIGDRMDGRPMQKTEISGKDGEAVMIVLDTKEKTPPVE
jgi:hypothetical protein